MSDFERRTDGPPCRRGRNHGACSRSMVFRVHLEPLTRLVETADYLAFREIALRHLHLRGYEDVVLKDGWNDGGSDFAVGVLRGNPTPVAIQVTVQRADWQAKVKADLRRAQSELGLDTGIYITSRRIAQADFAKVADDLWATNGITARYVDSQTIASEFFERGEAGFVLTSLGIHLDSHRPDPVPPPDLKEDASYSFAFFGGATNKFRNSVIDQTLLSYLTRSGTARTREATVVAAATALQLAGDQSALVTARIDRMLQQGRLRVVERVLEVDDLTREGFVAMRALRETQWQILARDITDYLANLGLLGRSLEHTVAVVLEGAGSLFMGAASSAGVAAGMTQDPAPIRSQMRKRMKQIAVSLGDSGVSDRDIDVHVRGLAECVSKSEIGRVLMAGELFVSLAAMRPNNFERAFGPSARLEIYLDASVAIPMMASLLYEPGEQRFSRAASRIYEAARGRGVPMKLPLPYLEEAASHLIQARERYEPLLGSDEDLRFSTNAFVAHYSDLVHRGVVQSNFFRYAEALGYVERRASFERQRDLVMASMQTVLKRYGVAVVPVPKVSGDMRTYAEEAIAFTAHELGISREGRLLAHDAETIAYFMKSDSNADAVSVFCTWDRLHLRLRTRAGRAQWQALDPVMLGDLLVLTRNDQAGDLMATVDIALELSEEEGERGAAVLDGLVRIEREALHDAELLRLAHEFKDAYMQALRDDARPSGFPEAWAAWKGGSRELVRQSELPLE